MVSFWCTCMTSRRRGRWNRRASRRRCDAKCMTTSVQSSSSSKEKEKRGAYTWLQRGRTRTAQQRRNRTETMLLPGTYVEKEDEWLIVDEHFDEHMRLKEHLLSSSHRANVLCREREEEEESCATSVALEDGERAALQRVLHFQMRCGRVRVEEVDEDGDPLVVERTSDGKRFNALEFASDGRALELCSRLAQEDFVLMRRGNAGRNGEEEHIVCSACVCFSFGDLPRRIGLGLGAVHRAVDGYERDLSAPMNKLISSLRPEMRMCRSNWDVKWSSNLVSHHLPDEKGIEGDVANMHIKIEYQTLIRLDETHTLFSIRSFIEKLTSISDFPGAAANLATNVRSIVNADDMRAFTSYKELGDTAVAEKMLAFLDAVTQQEEKDEEDR